jgi:hypothetical protein
VVDKRSLKVLDRMLIEISDSVEQADVGDEFSWEIIICDKRVTLRASIEKMARLYLVSPLPLGPQCPQSHSQARP